jgi:hypothetical protein
MRVITDLRVHKRMGTTVSFRGGTTRNLFNAVTLRFLIAFEMTKMSDFLPVRKARVAERLHFKKAENHDK